MSVSLYQQIKIASHLTSKKLNSEQKKIPIVLMLEPTFKTNLKTKVCGKSDYPEAVLNEYLSPEKCIYSVQECDAPIVSITGGEPLLLDDMPEIVEGLVKKKKYVYLTTNGLLLNKNIFDYVPSKYFTISVQLNGLKEDHDKIVGQDGVFENAIDAIQLCKVKGFNVTINCSIYLYQRIKNIIEFLNFITDELKVDGINITPGFPYERASDQENFLNRDNTIKFFRNVFKSKKLKNWRLNHTSLYLDFLAGNQSFFCTPWATPTRNIFGWQKPCYHLSEGYYKTYQELIEKTDWKKYGTGNYEKCTNCMTHCGYEPSAIQDIFNSPLKAISKKMLGIKTTGPIVEEVSNLGARNSEDLHDKIVESKMYELDLM